MEDRIIEIVVSKDEITWQSMLLNLVRSEGMDPWNIDISSLTRKYVEMLGRLKGLDFRVSGKMVLAAALLLRLKTTKLVSDDIMELDRLMSPHEEAYSEDEFYEELEQQGNVVADCSVPELLPRTPQPRNRKVSIYDLIGALQQALEVRDRRVIRRMPLASIRLPEKKIDITKLTTDVLERIRAVFEQEKTVLFSRLVSSGIKEDRIMVFISLIYLSHLDLGKVELVQKEPFGEIEVVPRASSVMTVVNSASEVVVNTIPGSGRIGHPADVMSDR